MACLSTVWYPTPVFLAIRCACSRSAIGTRIEMARVAFRLACSMSWSNTFESVFKIFEPAGRITFPSLSARANSRRVCRRPCGVAYQSASSASDLNFGTSVDVRGTIPPVSSAVRPERALERDPYQLAAGPDPRFLKQLLQRRLERAIANAELGANLLIREALEYASQDLLLAFGQQRADPLLLPLVDPIGHELNHFRIDPDLSSHNQPDGFG